MDAAPITRVELVHFAQQVLWLAFFAGVAGACAWSMVMQGFESFTDWLFDRSQRLARIAAARDRAARGMGQRPMLDPSRAAYPSMGEQSSLARRYVASRGPRFTPTAPGRVVKHSEDPRPQTVPQACPDSCLKDKRAGGAPALRCAHSAGDDSGETLSVLQELTPALPGPLLPAQGV